MGENGTFPISRAKNGFKSKGSQKCPHSSYDVLSLFSQEKLIAFVGG